MDVKTCFITSFYDLATIENNSVRRNSTQYYEFAEEILKRPIDLFFIGEDVDVTRVWKLRKDAGLLERTFCLSMPFTSLPTYEYIPALKKIIDEKGVYGIKGDARLSANYVALTWSKLAFLQKAANLNPFESSHFCWIDFGYFHMREQFDYLMPGRITNDIFLNINNSWVHHGTLDNRFRICLLNDFTDDDIIDSKKYYSNDNFQMAATIMGGGKEVIEIIWEKFKKQIALTMRLGIATPEENIIGRIAYFFPELFDYTLGYYSTSLQNFAQITKFPENTYELGIKWRREEKKQFAFDVLSKIADGIMSGQGDIVSKNIVYEVFYELIICAFYVNYQAYCYYRDYYKEWLKVNNYEIKGLLEMNLSF